MSTRWIFIRHGESTANAGGWLAGHQDVDLTPRGVEQAVELRSALAHIAPDAVFCSDLLRARRTAALALSGRDLPVTYSAALRERTIGRWEGSARATLVERGDMATLLRFHGRPPGGESQADLARRALTFLGSQQVNGVALVFAHAGMIRAVVGVIDGVPPEEIGLRRVANTAQLTRQVDAAALLKLAARLTEQEVD